MLTELEARALTAHEIAMRYLDNSSDPGVTALARATLDYEDDDSYAEQLEFSLQEEVNKVAQMDDEIQRMKGLLRQCRTALDTVTHGKLIAAISEDIA